MTREECKQYAEKNPEFEAYCVRFCRSKKITKDDGVYALKLVQNVAEDYMRKEGKA